MTVKELIEELEKWDSSLLVVVQGYEGGYDDIVMGKIQVAFKEN